MKTPFGLLLGISLACVSAASAGAAAAAELEVEGSRLLVNGMLDGTAIKAFEAHLATGQIRTVIFENSAGGTAEAATEYARVIRASGVNTEAKGQCQAACAYAFLAGKEHRFGRGLQINGLLIPVAARPMPADLASRWKGDEVHRSLAEFTDGPAEGDITPAPAAAAAVAPAAAAMPVSTSKERWQPSQGVLFTSTPTLFGRVYNSFYCDGTQGRDLSRCELLSDADPYKLGVLTP